MRRLLGILAVLALLTVAVFGPWLLSGPERKAQGVLPRPGLAADPGLAVAGAGAGRAGRDWRGDESDGITFEPLEVLVANPPPHFRTRAGALGYRVVETQFLRQLDAQMLRVRLPADESVEAAIARLRGLFPQAVVDANHHYRIAAGAGTGPSHARTAIGWGNLPRDCGRGVRIGMIDAGVDTDHSALAGARLAYREFHRPGRRPGSADHGTAVAALMVGQHEAGRGWGGLVPGAELYAANIFEITEAGRAVATAGGLLGAIDWIVGHRVHVLNLSIAGPDNKVVRRVVDKARRLDFPMVAAAGNWGSERRLAYPAAYDDVIAVTAVGTDRRVYSHANRGQYVEFAAPGVRLWTAVPEGGRYQSGTSFASPFVSVLVGVAVADGSPGDPGVLRAHLRRGAIDLGPPGRDPVFGWGLVTAPPACKGSA